MNQNKHPLAIHAKNHPKKRDDNKGSVTRERWENLLERARQEVRQIEDALLINKGANNE